MKPLETIALAVGVEPGVGCRCAVCADSVFDAATKLPSSFADYASLLAPETDIHCKGCEKVLSGRPGDDPPPLRTRSLIVAGGRLSIVDRPAMWAALTCPPPGMFVLSYAVSSRKHHMLHAGVSTASHMCIGSDSGTIDYVPARDKQLLDAVSELLSRSNDKQSFPRRAIESGFYQQSSVMRFGAARHAVLETIVAMYRRARPLLLRLILWCCPSQEQPREEIEDVIDPVDAMAARLLGAIAYGSAYRVERGIEFWGGFFTHRVERFKRLALRDFVSRLMTECQCMPKFSAVAVELMSSISEEETSAVEASLRDRSSLVLALSYEQSRAMKDGDPK